MERCDSYFELFKLMAKPKLCVDICSGKGGFSKAFKDHGWDVVTIDILKKFKPTIQADVRHLPLREDLKPEILLASPPCTHFSLSNPRWPRKGIKEAMEIVGACFEAVAALSPKHWVIENPRGRLRKLAPFLPRFSICYSDYDHDYPCQKPTDLWGNINLPMVKKIRRPRSSRKEHRFDRALPRDSASRSEIPRGVSRAILEGLEGRQL